MSLTSQTSKVKAIIFDVGGVLASNLDWYRGWGEWLKDEEMKEKVEKNRKVAWENLKEQKDYGEERFWKECLEPAGLYNEENLRKCEKYIREGFKPYHSSLALAQRLQSRGYIVGICSNHSQEWFTEIYERFCFDSAFQNPHLVVASYQVNCSKPNFDIFNVVMDRIHSVDSSVV